MVSSLLSEEMRRKKMEGSTKDSLVVRVRLVERYKGKFFGENLSWRVDLNPRLNQKEDVGNVVKLGITKRIVSRGRWKSVRNPTRSNRLRERLPHIREVMCT
jgi:hypothetical protein